VGVFLDQPWGDVQAAAAAAGVDLVQLHGAEDPAAVAEALQGPFRWPVIKVLHVPAAAVSHASAQIGDGADGAARGVLSFVNETARGLGLAEGMSCRAALERLSAATLQPSPMRSLRWQASPL
jgi:hypothetical protein